MQLLYSNILPLGTNENQSTIIDCFHEQLSKADRVDIAVGYTSNASIIELDSLIQQYGLRHICLTIGMYYIEGMPESAYHTAMKLNRKWQSAGIGEIRIVKSFKYHGKLYCFYKDGVQFLLYLGPPILEQ